MMKAKHRNGETEPPTVAGLYWMHDDFGGELVRLEPATDGILSVANSLSGDANWQSVALYANYWPSSRWWGPVEPPWEQDKIISHIRTIVDEACFEAKHVEPRIQGAINWGDLGCAAVGTKDSGYYAVVEEADAGNYELQKYILDALAAQGFENVEVTTEW